MRKRSLGVSALFFTLVTGAAAFAAAPGTFQQIGDMTTARFNPTTTVLNDGTVLVTGGWKRVLPADQIVSQAAAERFDPKTSTFSAVGSMAYPRAHHAAVRLQDGRVLVVGGSNDDFPSNEPQPVGVFIVTAEIFDPATGKFSSTGDLITSRLNPTATLLPNGNVLVVGGWNKNTVETAELFDPGTGKFTVAAPMVIGRNQNASVALPDGRVVILGGYHREKGPQRNVEIYDPNTNIFSAAGQMVEGRAQFKATLLPDGRILAVGGTSGPPNAGGGATTVLSSVEIYDPAAGQSAVTDHLAFARFGHAAAALADGRVLVVGGQHSFDPQDPNVQPSLGELIDPVTGKVSPTGSMAGPRGQAFAAPLPDGRVLVIGGRSRLPFAEVYIP